MTEMCHADGADIFSQMAQIYNNIDSAEVLLRRIVKANIICGISALISVNLREIKRDINYLFSRIFFDLITFSPKVKLIMYIPAGRFNSYCSEPALNLFNV